jgi:hypothetical protein
LASACRNRVDVAVVLELLYSQPECRSTWGICGSIDGSLPVEHREEQTTEFCQRRNCVARPRLGRRHASLGMVVRSSSNTDGQLKSAESVSFAGRIGDRYAETGQGLLICYVCRKTLKINSYTYLPMQKVEKIRLRMSSGGVWPVRESRAQRAR